MVTEFEELVQKYDLENDKDISCVRDLLDDVDVQDKQLQRYAASMEEIDFGEFLTEYAKYRSLGMLRDNAAILCGITPGRMKAFMYGVGISRQEHKLLLKIEQQAEAMFEAYHLTKIRNADSWQASAWSLEKLNKRYKKDADTQVNIVQNFEDGARMAAKQLQELRERQKKIDSGTINED